MSSALIKRSASAAFCCAFCASSAVPASTSTNGVTKRCLRVRLMRNASSGDLRVDRDLHRAAISVRHRTLALGFLRNLGELRRLDPLQPVRRHLKLRREDLDARLTFV